MPKRGRTRLIAQQQLDATAEVIETDYFEQFLKRKKPNNVGNDRDPKPEVLGEQLDDRTARRRRREAAKLGQSSPIEARRVSPRQGNVQLSEREEGEEESGGSAEEEGEDDDDGGADGVDHARITQAMNQARNPTTKPTINGIGSLRRNNQSRHTEASSDIEEDNQEELVLSQSPEGDNGPAPRNTNKSSRGRYCANGKAPQQQEQRSHKGRGRPSHKDDTNASTRAEDESEDESSTEIDDQLAEDTAFVEAPQQGEETETVKVIINSMGGIFKTLQHPAWTDSIHWDREFASEDNDDDQKTCETRSGKGLMEEMQGLNNILEEATDLPEDSSEDGHDITSAAIEYLRTRSVDVQRHLIRMDKVVDEICRRKLRPLPRTANPRTEAQAVKKRKAMLRDLSQRLIPMLTINVKKACDICPSEDNRSRTTLHLDCFRLQFFLKPLGWADRLHKARERCLTEDSQTGADNPDEVGSRAQDCKKARDTFGSQLDALLYACRKAEREIQDKAAEAGRREREAENKRQNRERAYERQREREAEEKRKQEEERTRYERQTQAFIQSTRALRSRPDPMRELWVQSQEVLPGRFRATSTVRAAPGLSPGAHGQSTARAARSQGGPSGTAQAQPVYQSDDPFLENYRAEAEQASNTSSPWPREDEKALIKAIRYKKNYDVASMAKKLGRSEYEVARMAAFLKQGYREYYREKGADIPAWAL